ncbi:MAG: ATP-binding protein [Nitrospirae bacterium]|nr:ATP-binding protein [Nitrospirota bacterium]
MELTNELKQTLKKLRLSGVLSTLADRASYAKGVKLSHFEFKELVLRDEVDRREHGSLNRRIQNARLNPQQTIERFDWDAQITIDRDRIKDLLSLNFMDRHENVIFCGPVGVGKTHIANALGLIACRKVRNVLILKANDMFTVLLQSRADNSLGKELVRLIGMDLLIIDDFGLKALTQQQSNDIYEVVVERYGRASTIITSNRHVDEWTPLFVDPIMANSALDRLAHNAHQIIIEGESYRRKLAPKYKE